MRLFVQERYSEKSGGPEKNKYHTEQNTLSQIEAIERSWVSVAPGVGEWRNRGPSTPSQRVWKIEVGSLCGGLRLGAACAWVPQLDHVQALSRPSGEGVDHVPRYCHCLCHSSAPGSSGARGGVTGLNTDAGQMAASISRQLSALKCGVKAGTCQDESQRSPCAFTSDSETDTDSPQRDRHQIPSYSLQSTCPVRKTLSQSGTDKGRGTGGGAAVYRTLLGFHSGDRIWRFAGLGNVFGVVLELVMLWHQQRKKRRTKMQRTQ
ncbi:hypothetical protein QQF64_012308, partial [Cirrhinus molitorella]